MSLIADLDRAHARLAECGPKVSALVRGLKGQIPPAVYEELQVALCGVAAGITEVKLALGVARMTGEAEQRPAQSSELELTAHVRLPLPPRVSPFPKHDVAAAGEGYREALRRVGDDTLADKPYDRNVSVEAEAKTEGRAV